MDIERAIILIGVKKTGRLPKLQAVESAVSSMKNWALSQGFKPDLVIPITDFSGNEVHVNLVYDAIENIIKNGTVEQLIIYFAGHGINNGQSEYWLLSDAPTNPNDAINVRGSAVLAERIGIPHTLFISDACRTAPEGIQALGITGSMIFPNYSPVGPADNVDRFYACLLGDPAHEIKDVNESTRVYRSVYTEVLVKALMGQYYPRFQSKENDYFIRPWPLKRELPSLVIDQLKDRGLHLVINQEPDANVTSDPEKAWISRINRTESEEGGDLIDYGIGITGAVSLSSATSHVIKNLMLGKEVSFDSASKSISLVDNKAGESFEIATSLVASPFGPLHFETGCGLKIRGEKIDDIESKYAEFEILNENLVRASIPNNRSSAKVLLRLKTGSCLILPIINNFLTALTFEEDQLIDVSFEPSEYSERGERYNKKSAKIRQIRAFLASGSRFGLFNLESVEDDNNFIQSVIELVDLDPSISIYSSYALHDIGRKDLVSEIFDVLFYDLDLSLFDVKLLSDKSFNDTNWQFASFLPLLARGWALKDVYSDYIINPQKEELAHYLLPSTWTLFSPEAYDALGNILYSEREIM